MKKVVLGLSGGVDSAVCAHLLKKTGYDVLGVFLSQNGSSPCDALEIAEYLEIPFESVDITSCLSNYVCRPFIDGYLRGQTPNPCIVCNPTVKFPALSRVAQKYKADFVATGHYANTGISPSGRRTLIRGDAENDQSYMLYRLSQTQLSNIIFPLGKYRKTEVRKLAEESGLPVAKKPDSMEICFIPDGDYASYIEQNAAVPPPGNFIDASGNILGEHRGIHHYTVGQRRGLGISAKKRVFVSGIDPENNTVILSEDSVHSRAVKIRDVSWTSIPETIPLSASVKIRHSKNESDAIITAGESEGEYIISFDTPVRAPVSGQSAVFYDGALVLGGGIII